ncbi:hypothetical protein [Serratia liquefaciens]|uniref:hypothetical protein n=1 Tax=Serratia liquefaciens TaxID=614 RepID=UPI000F512B3C|nr:hypothetical protein [Serratia liquefaciens]
MADMRQVEVPVLPPKHRDLPSRPHGDTVQTARDALVGELRAQPARGPASVPHPKAGLATAHPKATVPTMGPELASLKTQLARMTAERDQQQAGRAALTTRLSAVLAEAQARRSSADGARDLLQRQLAVLQARLAQLQQSSAADSVRQATAPAARNGDVQKLQAALTEAVAKGAAAEQQRRDLQAQRDAAKGDKDRLSRQLTSVQAQSGQDTVAQARLKAQLATATKTTTALQAQLAALQAAEQARVIKVSEADQAATARVNGLVTQITGLRGQVATLTAAQGAAQKSVAEANAALTAAKQGGLADKVLSEKMQVQLTAVTTANADLKTQLAALQAQREKARALPAGGETKPTATAAVLASPDLTTPQAQQAYASGVMMADLLRRTLALQTDLGEKPDTALLLAGVKDGVTGAVRLDKRVLTTQSEAVVARLSAKEKAKYDRGVKRLEGLTAKQTLLKRNGTLFFVQVRKGSRQLKEGESLSISLRESTLDGRVMREGKAVRGVYSARLPYPVQQALMLGGLGGSVDVYCFASDIYPPNDVPEGLFAYTLMKYTVTTYS